MILFNSVQSPTVFRGSLCSIAMQLSKLVMFYVVATFQQVTKATVTNNKTNLTNLTDVGSKSNLTNGTEGKVSETDPAWAHVTGNPLLFLILVSSVMLVSLIGNLLVLVAIYKNYNKRMKVASNHFIANISIASLVYSVCYMPRLISVYAIGGYQWLVTGTIGYIFCTLTTFSAEAMFIVPASSLVFIAVDRFMAVFFPLKKAMSVRATWVTIGCTWLTAVAFTISESINTKFKEFNKKTYCLFYPTKDYKHYINTQFAVCLAVPLVVALVLYSAIVVKLFVGNIPGNKSAANQELRDRRSRRVLLMSVVTIVFFAASVTPKWICTFFPALSGCGNIPFALLYVFCTLNSCIYAIFIESYRKAIRKVAGSVLCWEVVQVEPSRVTETNRVRNNGR